jgi:hypothetical protein
MRQVRLWLCIRYYSTEDTTQLWYSMLMDMWFLFFSEALSLLLPYDSLRHCHSDRSGFRTVLDES